MTRAAALLRNCVLASSVAALTFASAHYAVAQQAQLMLACSPTWEAIERCQSSGGHFDTLHCRCVRGQAAATVFHPCALVCIDGFLDAAACRCVHPK